MSLIHQYTFLHPSPKIVSFDPILKLLKKVEPESQEKIQKLNKQRNKLIGFIHENKSLKEIILAIEEYLPFILGLVEGMSKHIQDVQKATSVGITFTFTSGLLNCTKNVSFSKSQYFSQSSLQFELFMMLWIYSYTLINYGHLKINENSEKEATNAFLNASGVLEYLFTEINVCQKIGLNIQMQGLPETFPISSSLISKYCISMTNMIAIKTAIQLNKKSSVIARLCIAVYQLFDKMKEDYDQLQQLCNEPLDLSFKLYIQQNRILYRSLSFIYLSIDSQNQKLSLEFILLASKQLDEIDLYKISNNPFLKSKKLLHEQIKSILNSLEKNNQERIGDLKNFIPEGVTILKSIPFTNIKPSFTTI